MSTITPSIEPEIEDFDHDEPTQFMLQLMQTSIDRKKEERSNIITKYFINISTPKEVMIRLLIYCPILAAVVTIFKCTGFNSGFFIEYVSGLFYVSSVCLVLIGFRYISLLFAPVHQKGGLLDISKNDILILSGVLGFERYRYLVKKHQIDRPTDNLKSYFFYVISTLVCLGFAGYFLKSLAHHPISLGMTFLSIIAKLLACTFLMSLLLSVYRSTIALKLIIYNLKWSFYLHGLIVFVWHLWWLILGFMSKFILMPYQQGIHDFFYPFQSSVLMLIINGSFIFLIGLSVVLNIVRLFLLVLENRKTTHNQYIQLIYKTRFLIIYILIGLPIFLHETSRFIYEYHHSYQNISFSADSLSILVSILLCQYFDYWLGSKNSKISLKPWLLLAYISSVSCISIIFMFIKLFGLGGYHVNQILSILFKNISDFSNAPSIWGLINNFSSNRFVEIAPQFQFIVYILMFLFPVLITSLFARFMENIALQKPATPKT